MTTKPDPAAPAPASDAAPVPPIGSGNLAAFFERSGHRSTLELPRLACEYWLDALLEAAPPLRPARPKLVEHLEGFWK